MRQLRRTAWSEGFRCIFCSSTGGETLAENVESAFLDPSSILYEEPMNLLKQEIQKASQYNAILAAIAGGASQNNQIATAVGLSSTEITYYLKELQRLELVMREVPILGGGRRATYHISDNLFRFWYRFVMPHRPTIERGILTRALAAVEGHMSEYMGPVFEEICTQWIWRKYTRGDLDFDFDDIGRWWGNDPRMRQEAEIDIVCKVASAAAAVGECKWRNEDFPVAELEKLMGRAVLANARPDVRYYAFSKTGFSDTCRSCAEGNDAVRLVSFAYMAG